jgi:hypothetical protein
MASAKGYRRLSLNLCSRFANLSQKLTRLGVYEVFGLAERVFGSMGMEMGLAGCFAMCSAAGTAKSRGFSQDV